LSKGHDLPKRGSPPESSSDDPPHHNRKGSEHESQRPERESASDHHHLLLCKESFEKESSRENESDRPLLHRLIESVSATSTGRLSDNRHLPPHPLRHPQSALLQSTKKSSLITDTLIMVRPPFLTFCKFSSINQNSRFRASRRTDPAPTSTSRSTPHQRNRYRYLHFFPRQHRSRYSQDNIPSTHPCTSTPT